jgi:hypothetical protein
MEERMYDCSDSVVCYHDDEITLPQEERDAMRDRRDTNRKRLKDGLNKTGKPTPLDFKSQGSYAMKTMIQHPDRDFDIDDGVYFEKVNLVGSRGGEMTALDARQMVCDVVDDARFNKKPEARKNCVRVYYNAGYHVDIPVYRRVDTSNLGIESYHYELASSEWIRSDARDVTDWFEAENSRQSPDDTNGRQLRRITRDIKKFAKSRESWRSQILSGFGITKLVTECFVSDALRDDVSLYGTMKAIRDRLSLSLVVNHPVTPNHTITKGTADSKAEFLKDRLTDALNWLTPVFDSNCTQEKALASWDKVFSTEWFTDRFLDKSKRRSASTARAAAILRYGLLKEIGAASSSQEAVRKEGGGRYA